MDILFLSHCVPNPPDKGEKIRAYHELQYLASRYRVHLACLARSEAEARSARELRDRCASVHVELVRHAPGLARAALRFAAGDSLTVSYYANRRLKADVERIAQRGIAATLVYSSAMAPYAPPGIPLILDYVDVDSEKWLDYGRSRGLPFRLEGERLRRLEREAAARARRTFFCTERERALFRSFAPQAPSGCIENGLDFGYFDPRQATPLPELAGRRFLAFVGSMDYYPNQDAVCWFVEQVLPWLQAGDPGLEMLIVGRHPGRRVRALQSRRGVTVTGTVPDVRPYLVSALAVVAPLRIARGIQNKVLEALAMGKAVLASPAVCETFGRDLPPGILACASAADYAAAVARGGIGWTPGPDVIRASAERRFVWSRNLALLDQELAAAGQAGPDVHIATA